MLCLALDRRLHLLRFLNHPHDLIKAGISFTLSDKNRQLSLFQNTSGKDRSAICLSHRYRLTGQRGLIH